MVIETHAFSIAGTFNAWTLDAPRAERIDTDKYAVRLYLPRGRHAFKWVQDASWETAWGCRGSEPLLPPTEGALVRGGADIVLNVWHGGEHVLTFQPLTRRWSVTAADPWPGPENALWPEHAARLLEPLRERLRGGGPFAYDWHRWDLLEPFLERGALAGAFPLREGHRVLFVHNAALHGQLSLVGTMNGWNADADRFERVGGTDVHLLYRELEAGSGQHYKLQHRGGFFKDPLNRWVATDGMPVPMFQTGEFNSVLDLAMPPCERGDNLVWLKDFRSVVRGNARDVFVMLPPGYARSTDERYPVLYVNDGNEALTRAGFHHIARRTIEAGDVRPCILVFVALARQNDRNFEYGDLDGRGLYAELLARELVPYIDRSFRTRTERGARAITGASFGGTISYYVAWRYPELFARVAGQGTSFYVNDWDILRLYSESPRRGMHLYLDSARASAPGRPRDNDLSARYAEKVLREAGYNVKHLKRQDQRHDWSSWAERFPDLLHSLWPKGT